MPAIVPAAGLPVDQSLGLLPIQQRETCGRLRAVGWDVGQAKVTAL